MAQRQRHHDQAATMPPNQGKLQKGEMPPPTITSRGVINGQPQPPPGLQHDNAGKTNQNNAGQVENETKKTPTPRTPVTPHATTSFQAGSVRIGALEYETVVNRPSVNTDVLSDFDFDSFLHQDGDVDNFNFDNFLDGEPVARTQLREPGEPRASTPIHTNTTISRDYTGSKEEKEREALGFLAEKYGYIKAKPIEPSEYPDANVQLNPNQMRNGRGQQTPGFSQQLFEPYSTNNDQAVKNHTPLVQQLVIPSSLDKMPTQNSQGLPTGQQGDRSNVDNSYNPRASDIGRNGTSRSTVFAPPYQQHADINESFATSDSEQSSVASPVSSSSESLTPISNQLPANNRRKRRRITASDKDTQDLAQEKDLAGDFDLDRVMSMQVEETPYQPSYLLPRPRTPQKNASPVALERRPRKIHTSGSDLPHSQHPSAEHRRQSLHNQVTTRESLNKPISEAKQRKVLLQRISKLEEEKKLLELQSFNSQAPSWSKLYRVSCGRGNSSIYTDPPILYRQGDLRHLQGQCISTNVDLFIARQKTLTSFIVYQNYRCCEKSSKVRKSDIQTKRLVFENSLRPLPTTEDLFIVSESLAKALTTIVDFTDHDDEYYPCFDVGSALQAPYLWYYHNRTQFEASTTRERLKEEQRTEYNMFLEYISLHFDEEYREVDTLLSKHMITARYFEYLFNPECIILSDESEEIIAFEQVCWQKEDCSVIETYDGQRYVHYYELSVNGRNWDFDEVFQLTSKKLNIKFKTSHGSSSDLLEFDEEIEIKSLPFYPLQHAEIGVKEKLQNRGLKFWSCRHRNYVAYKGCDYKREEINTDTRFMVDFATFNKMHPEKFPTSSRLRDDLGKNVTASEAPPDGSFILLLPANVRGFNMQEKKWVDLKVDDITPVEWNKEAFKSLVADEDTKELITALVTNQIAAERGTDLMQGKGTGLIILLHGGPGTGKTLTAESVAEIAEKPLYRVTCGDIGTDPSSVEKYLETVLLLGKTWGCVVLLDEADVFLEQRTLQDLQRNALVSVFLRVLEYYTGILILTSNRVGTFDEAFKSRIQLALHYENLEKEQRKQVWEIFIKRLADFNKDNRDKNESELVDTEELIDHLDELSSNNMNGRQIRNAVTTARQLAIHKKEKMKYRHMKHVIKVAQKFEGYLLRVNEGTSDDQMAREDGVR